VLDAVDRALAEDLGEGDLTSRAVVPADARASARIEQRAPGVLAGLDVAEAVFRRVGPDLSWRAAAGEGSWRDPGPVAQVEGSARSVLAGERVALNFLGRLSGVATLTARYVAAVEGTGAGYSTPGRARPGFGPSNAERSSSAAGATTARASSTRSLLRRTTRLSPAGWERPPGARWLPRRPGPTWS